MGLNDIHSTLELSHVPWGPEVAADLEHVQAEDAGVSWYAQEVEARRLLLLSVTRDGERIGTVAYRIEAMDWGSEMVIVAGAGFDSRADLTEVVFPALEAVAANAGMASLRFHTSRKGLELKAARQGWYFAEAVYRKRV